MDTADDSEFELISLRLRVAHQERILICLFGVAFGGLMILNAILVPLIGKAGMEFEAMLAGKALPLATEWVLTYGETGLAGFFCVLVPLGTFIFLVAKKRTQASWYVAVAVLASLVLHWCFVVAALTMPFIPIVHLHG